MLNPAEAVRFTSIDSETFFHSKIMEPSTSKTLTDAVLSPTGKPCPSCHQAEVFLKNLERLNDSILVTQQESKLILTNLERLTGAILATLQEPKLIQNDHYATWGDIRELQKVVESMYERSRGNFEVEKCETRSTNIQNGECLTTLGQFLT